MITLRFYGKLGTKYGKVRQLEVRSLAEGFYAIETMEGGLYDLLMELEATCQGYHVQADERTIGQELLAFPCGTVYKITPILKGADTKGIIEIVAGVVLIAVAVVASIPSLGTSLAFLAPYAVQIGLLGIGLAAGGVARMMMSAPAQISGGTTANKASYLFSGPVNTVQQGECVPVAYGDVIVGSAVVSAGVSSENYNPD